MTRTQQRRAEALARASNPRSAANITAVYDAAEAAGLHDAEPGVNVLTFEAWKARGRYVRKGEKALCRLQTWVPIRDRKAATGDEPATKLRPRSVAVFHISQTEARH